MPVSRAVLLVAWLVGASEIANAQVPTTPTPGSSAPGAPAPASAPGAPPRVLNIVLVKVKRRAAGSYGALEASMVRAYERAKVKVYWVGLQSPKDVDDVLYLNLHDSQESAERVAAQYRDTLKQHPELARMQQRLEDLMISQTSILTTRRDEVDPIADRPDFATMRALRLTVFQVRPGREGDFITAMRTTNAKDRSWLLYEANDSSTFALVTPMRSQRTGRNDGPAIPRTLRRSRGVYTKAETRVYAVRPAMSHVSQTFAALNPQFWRPVPTGMH